MEKSMKTKPKKIIHINQHNIKWNAKNPKKKRLPVITTKQGKKNIYGFEVIINEHTKIIYSPDKPLSCGAKVWLETSEPIKIKGEMSYQEVCEIKNK